MTQKIPCPTCGELNYEASPLCWKCGSAMKLKPPATEPVATVAPTEPVATVAPTEPEPVVAAAAPVAPPTIPDPPAPTTQDPAPGPQPPALSPQPSPKPAELEAAALKDKDYVTPPVDVEETPSSLGEWLAYGWSAVKGAGPAFKHALDDYDARRGRTSGGMSSYGCVLMLIVCAILAFVLLMILQFLSRGAAQ